MGPSRLNPAIAPEFATDLAKLAIQDAGQRRAGELNSQDTDREALWRERALNAEDGLKTAHAEVLCQRTRTAALLGEIRDLQAEWTQDAIQRVTSENTTLKQRVRQLAGGTLGSAPARCWRYLVLSCRAVFGSGSRVSGCG